MKKFIFCLITISGFALAGYGVDADSALLTFAGVGIAFVVGSSV